MDVPTVSLPSGDELPTVGLGTWQLHGDELRASLRAAFDAGYTHIDTAEGYGNEAVIGEMLDSADRDGLFVTSKVLAANLDYESLREACLDSLDRLGTDYLDLYLVHWPNPAISLRATLHAMASLYDDGAVRNVGVSNFSAYQLSNAHHITDVPIAVNQIEFHPFFQRPDLVDYCRETGTVVEAAAPLARTAVLDNETVTALAEKYDRSPAQVVLRWAVERDVVPLPRSSAPAHVRANLDLFDWSLEPADRERLDALERDEPVYDFPARDWTGDIYGISR